MSGKKELFKPIIPNKVRLFVCGPTVYDFSHIGHARAYLAFDLFARYLKSKGLDVYYLQNITDIDDKIIKRAAETQTSWKQLSERFTKEYQKNMKELEIVNVNRYAKATEHIREIVSQVERLVNLGAAYRIDDGIYFDVSKFKNYGRLSKRSALQAEDAVSRIDDAKSKKNKADFCLWKFYSGIESEPKWSSQWGWGRPGWHIEDTAITEKYFGPQYDIHGGGRDLIFPHHEAEIAQMETLSNKSPMVKYWMHVGFLTTKSQKMSKSLANFVTINDFLKQYPARLLRYFFLKVNYRSPIDYNEESISQAQNDLARIDEFIQRLNINPSKENNKKIDSILKRAQREFTLSLDDDLNTPKALAAIFELIKNINPLIDTNSLSKNDIKKTLDSLKSFDQVFGFIFVKAIKKKAIPKEIKDLADQRRKFRKAKQWDKADELRKAIEEKGYILKDTANKYVLQKKG